MAHVQLLFLLLSATIASNLAYRSMAASPGQTSLREREKLILDTILQTPHYDRHIRPSGVNGTDGPTVVDVNLMFRSFPSISDNNMEYSTILTFREEWLDERLKYNDFGGRIKYLTLNDPKKVWMPDLFFSNEREGHFHDIIVPNVYIRIFPNGNVLYSIRISLTLSCPMNLRLYPLDRQMCTLSMISYGWTTEDLVFRWKEVDPVQVRTKNMNLPRFILEKFQTDFCNSITTTGEYSCLKVNLLFKREFSYYLIQIYIPCCMLVIVSWVSFWLDANAVAARVSLGVTTLLTMATQTTGINNSLPPVSYTKAIDVWTGICLTFVFGALLEFALVNYASRSDVQRVRARKQACSSWELDHGHQSQALSEMSLPSPDTFVGDRLAEGADTFTYMKASSRPQTECLLINVNGRELGEFYAMNNMESDQYVTHCWRSWISNFTSRSKRIDVISRIIFPVMFALFSLTYWTTYIHYESNQDE